MDNTTGGELLASALANEGVKFVFGLPCPEIDPFLVALEGNGIRFVPIRHEAAGVHMAEGLYKTTGQVAVVLGNPGPGSANLIPGLITAKHEGVPVLAITSQHRSGIVYPATPATFQGQDQLDLFKPAVKWNGPVFEWSRIPELVRMAFREMWAGRPGPVQLEVPGPVLYAIGDSTTAPIYTASINRNDSLCPTPHQVKLTAERLASAKTPVIFAGTGVERGKATEALLALAERLGCPVIPSLAGRSVIAHDHPLFFSSQSPAADALRRDADLILAVGTRLGNLDVPYDKYWGPSNPERLVQIDIDPRNIGVSRPVGIGLVADAKLALEGISAALVGQSHLSAGRVDLAERRNQDSAWRNDWLSPISEWQNTSIHPAHAMGLIGAEFGRDAVYCTDGGMTSLWAGMALPSARANSFHGILELGMLGVGVPAAVGAKLGAPEREVVCVTGDGAAGFNIMELQVAARERLNITVVVMADGQWTMEIPNEQARWGKTFGTTMGEVGWEQVAIGLGCHGETVSILAELPAALKRAHAYEGPALVCVRTSVEANLSVPQSVGGRFFEVYFGPSA